MRFIAMLAAAVAVGWLFGLVNVPVAWMLGPLVVGITHSVLTRRSYPVHPYFQVVGQICLGLAAGVNFPLDSIKVMGTHWLPMLFLIVITGGLSMLMGYVLWRWAGVDPATGFMGSLPGAAASMVAMSSEMGADAMVVAVLQYLRVMLVIFLAPIGIGLMAPVAGGAAVAAPVVSGLPDASLPLALATLAVAGAGGAWVGRKLRLPSPNFLGPFLALLGATALFKQHIVMPPGLFEAGMLILGVSIGARFDVSMARKLGKVALIDTLMVVGLIAISLAVGYAVHMMTGIDLTTAVIGAVPGAMEAMVATAVDLGGDAGLVLAMHMTRWFIILVTGPALVLWLVRSAKAHDS